MSDLGPTLLNTKRSPTRRPLQETSSAARITIHQFVRSGMGISIKPAEDQ
jgi:hypothetical protein